MQTAKLRIALLLVGFTSVIAQVVLMRELMVVFGGNEISLGIVLSCWLVWTAVGSAVPWGGSPSVARLEVLVAAAFPVALLVVRSSRAVFQTARGEVLGFGPLLATAFVALGLFCPFCGRLYTAGTRRLAKETGSLVGSAGASVYFLETAGSALGGLAASLWLVRAFAPFQIAALLAGLNLAAAAMLLARNFWLPLACALSMLLALPPAARYAERSTLESFWRGFRLVAVRNTAYSNLAVLETEGSRSLAENGLVVTTVPDPAAAEEAVHVPLAAHPDPRRIVLVGGGANGSIAEILKHPGVAFVDYVELDPAVPELARQLFPGAIPADPRIRVHAMDGRLFLKTWRERFDVIVINLPEPRTTQLNRFYTAEFFGEAARRLETGGILALAFPASENYLSPEAVRFLQCIYQTLREVFPRVAVLPGETVHFLGSFRALETDTGTLIERLDSRRVETAYISRYQLPFRLTSMRRAQLLEQIAPDAATPVNRDFAPVACFFDLALWSARFGGLYRDLLEQAGRIPVWAIAAALLLLFGALPLAFRSDAAAVATAATGFTMMGVEILLLLGFQALYGYVYQQLALLVAAFMAGMALGSWAAQRSKTAPSLVPVQLLVAAAPFAICVLLPAGNGIAGVMALVCGALGGYQFGAASRHYFVDPNRSAGKLYALDLAGSSIGALAAGVYTIPVFGFLRTAALLTLANAIPAWIAFSARRTPAR